VTLNPEFNKEFLDLAAGYTWYGDGREEYLRVGVLLEDFNFESKNNTSGRSNQDEIALQWTARMALGREWYVYTEGQVGSGFEREFTDAEQSPEIAAHDRSENRAQLRFSTAGDDGTRWSVWADWWDFSETKAFRVPGFDYEYTNTQVNLAAEHTRIVRDRHRLRFLLHFVDQSAASRGFNEHDYERSDILGGVFYEYLWAQSAATLAYAMGQPDIAFMSPDRDDFVQDDYRDKIIVGYRYVFSDNSQIRLSVSHEVAEKGFGGGAVQYQLFF
jgi:hypothetical protein